MVIVMMGIIMGMIMGMIMDSDDGISMSVVDDVIIHSSIVNGYIFWIVDGNLNDSPCFPYIFA